MSTWFGSIHYTHKTKSETKTKKKTSTKTTLHDKNTQTQTHLLQVTTIAVTSITLIFVDVPKGYAQCVLVRNTEYKLLFVCKGGFKVR